MRTVRMNLSAKSIQAEINRLEVIRQKIITGSQQLLNKLAEGGCQIAGARFAQAQYDGTNRDVQVSVAAKGEGTIAVVATGPAVLFIEFGTGVTYPDDPTIRASIVSGDVAGRGEYGKGRGKNASWVYYDENLQAFVSTQGNPSNGCMYHTREELKQRIAVLAKEVFQW